MKYKLIFKDDYNTETHEFNKEWRLDVEAEAVFAFQDACRIEHLSTNFDGSINLFLNQIPERIDVDNSLDYIYLRSNMDARLYDGQEVFWYQGQDKDLQDYECGDMSALVGMEES